VNAAIKQKATLMSRLLTPRGFEVLVTRIDFAVDLLNKVVEFADLRNDGCDVIVYRIIAKLFCN
jgi:hypothetical protein